MLNDIQNAFYEAITKNNHAPLAAYIQQQKPLDNFQRIAIYLDGIQQTLLRAMAEVYPVVNRLVGDDFFYAMAKQYCIDHPSKSPDLAEYGAEFADFIKTFKPAQSLEYLTDVAALEWAWHTIFQANTAPALNINELQTVPEEQQGNIVFTLPAGWSVLQSTFPIDKIWLANQSTITNPPTIDLDCGGVELFIWQNEMQPQMDIITKQEYFLLSAMQQQKSIAEICDELSDEVDISLLLPDFIKQGWVCLAKPDPASWI